MRFLFAKNILITPATRPTINKENLLFFGFAKAGKGAESPTIATGIAKSSTGSHCISTSARAFPKRQLSPTTDWTDFATCWGKVIVEEMDRFDTDMAALSVVLQHGTACASTAPPAVAFGAPPPPAADPV